MSKSSSQSPYQSQPPKAFWRFAAKSLSDPTIGDFQSNLEINKSLKIATAGSCFAQHIGKAFRARGLNYLDLEAAPSFLTKQEANQFGYGIYSCRYGNIYTTRQLVQLLDEALGDRFPRRAIWERNGRYYDALRPGVEPIGLSSVEEVQTMRRSHLSRVRQMFESLDLFVFTLGLTEVWVDTIDETAFPSAPGVIAGTYDPATVEFINLRYNDVYSDLLNFVQKLRTINKNAKILLTVSPVPLAATATNHNAISATSYSKSVLRASAQDFCEDVNGAFYFPSFEIITSHVNRGRFYEDDLRSIKKEGVDLVMAHFFSGDAQKSPTGLLPETHQPIISPGNLGYEMCEEALLADEYQP